MDSVGWVMWRGGNAWSRKMAGVGWVAPHSPSDLPTWQAASLVVWTLMAGNMCWKVTAASRMCSSVPKLFITTSGGPSHMVCERERGGVNTCACVGVGYV